MAEVILGGKPANVSTIMGDSGSSKATPPNTVIIEAETPTEGSPSTTTASTVNNNATQSAATPGTEQPTDKATSKSEPETKNPDGKDDPQTEEDNTSDSFIIGDCDVTELAAEYERDGVLSEESYKELADNGFPKEVVDAYIRGVKASTQEQTELAQKEVDAILQEAGGLERYEKVMAWASDKLSPEEQEAYNKAVTSSDPTVARLVVQGLMSRYEKEYGSNPSLLSGDGGTAGTPITNAFSNRSDMVQAMSDPRYGKDPDYTREIEGKILRSGLMRTGRR